MRVLAVSALFALAACQTPCPAPNAEPVTASFVCEDGSDLVATFTRNPDMARIVQEGFPTLDIRARPTGSGYRYAQGGAELRGRGAEARWTRPGGAETLCQRQQD